ncbi:unnamed protein product [Allacma fusca]|uniref:Uncharacterized protein n=1 Tax=Allacma fusca TaxID=39272 RepID=A0A8J2PCW2_9HEXA|nr:unnamed protein product [Allacma fusca]
MRKHFLPSDRAYSGNDAILASTASKWSGFPRTVGIIGRVADSRIYCHLSLYSDEEFRRDEFRRKDLHRRILRERVRKGLILLQSFNLGEAQESEVSEDEFRQAESLSTENS